MIIDAKIRQELINFLVPYMVDIRERKLLVDLSFTEYENLRFRIITEGTSPVFVNHLITTLVNYGHLDKDNHSLLAFLDVFKSHQGVDVQEKVENFKKRLVTSQTGSELSQDANQPLLSEQVISIPLLQPKDIHSSNEGESSSYSHTPKLPDGTIEAHSPYYLPRGADEIAVNAIQKNGVTITIKGAHQTGKSSLLVRVIEKARSIGKQVIYIDFQIFSSELLNDAAKFFKRFTKIIIRKLKLPDEIETFWEDGMGHSQLCTEYMDELVLPNLKKPIALAMDEVNVIYSSPFRSDFFSMLRAWHNKRAVFPEWKLIDIVLVTSTEPYQFIDDLNQSPFNIGVVINLEFFTYDETTLVGDLHKISLSEHQIATLYQLLNGHPFLTNRAIHLLSSGQVSFDILIDTASDWDGAFSEHLRLQWHFLEKHQELMDAMKSIIMSKESKRLDEKMFHRLKGAGLARRDNDTILPGCKLYADFFTKYLK